MVPKDGLLHLTLALEIMASLRGKKSHSFALSSGIFPFDTLTLSLRQTANTS